jgi:hypothetical protein
MFVLQRTGMFCGREESEGRIFGKTLVGAAPMPNDGMEAPPAELHDPADLLPVRMLWHDWTQEGLARSSRCTGRSRPWHPRRSYRQKNVWALTRDSRHQRWSPRYFHTVRFPARTGKDLKYPRRGGITRLLNIARPPANFCDCNIPLMNGLRLI